MGNFAKINISRRQVRWLLVVILLFSLVVRLIGLNNPKNEYFDEVYNVFTAKLMVDKDPKAWEWWNPNPEGFAYEWTHPPIAKECMWLGMAIFGKNSFGWRIPGALLGVGLVLLIYLISKRLFGDDVLALVSSALFALDGLPLVMSRIGMNDSYFLFFILFALYLFLIEKNFLSALLYGLAISSKWSAVWAVPIFVASFFILNKRLRLSYIWFLTIPPLVYIGSYIPMFLTGHNFETFIGVQKQMWWYHTGLNETHSYTSPWWSWPILLRPIWLYTKTTTDGLVKNIYAMGNPVVFWFGLVAVLISLYYILALRSKKLGLVIISYLFFFVPWAASPRIMFLYHYLPSVPFMTIATGYLLRRNVRWIIPVLLASLVMFIYLYPHWVGLPVSKALDDSYYWVESWR